MNEYSVEFLLIGGYAVNYYGFARYTGDIDFWLNPSAENKSKFIKMMEQFSSDKSAVAELNDLDFEKAQVISMGKPPLKIDFLTKVNLVAFEEAWSQKKELTLDETQVYVVNYNHLVTMKFNTGRTKDKLDIEELQKLNKNKTDHI